MCWTPMGEMAALASAPPALAEVVAAAASCWLLIASMQVLQQRRLPCWQLAWELLVALALVAVARRTCAVAVVAAVLW